MDGHARARELLTGAADRIAAMTVISTEMIDADTVVFGGPYWELVRPFYEPVVRHALDQPSARGPQPVELFSTAMGTRVGAIGAASVVLDARYVPRAPGRHQSLLG
jgi:predicted NBD/HSP70 family sugar kinase